MISATKSCEYVSEESVHAADRTSDNLFFEEVQCPLQFNWMFIFVPEGNSERVQTAHGDLFPACGTQYATLVGRQEPIYVLARCGNRSEVRQTFAECISYMCKHGVMHKRSHVTP
jgi:hypothetical protein